MKACLAWIAAFGLVLLVGLLFLVGGLTALIGGGPKWTGIGAGLVGLSGALCIWAARSRRFSAAVGAAADPLEGGLVAVAEMIKPSDEGATHEDDPFHGRTGRHALPTGVGIGILVVALVMALTAAFP